MPQITIQYKNKRSLEALQDLAKYFDYTISSPDSESKAERQITLNGISIIPADNPVDTSDLNEIFTGKNISPSHLRNEEWQRKK